MQDTIANWHSLVWICNNKCHFCSSYRFWRLGIRSDINLILIDRYSLSLSILVYLRKQQNSKSNSLPCCLGMIVIAVNTAIRVIDIVWRNTSSFCPTTFTSNDSTSTCWISVCVYEAIGWLYYSWWDACVIIWNTDPDQSAYNGQSVFEKGNNIVQGFWIFICNKVKQEMYRLMTKRGWKFSFSCVQRVEYSKKAWSTVDCILSM